ncbi:hypothetical protein ACQPYE_05315 [Actinosynnema sp. CA-299493]
MHVHFMPQRVLDEVWAFFDEASRHYGVDWSIRYRLPDIPYDYSAQLAAIEGWAAADDRLGEPFLRAVLHDNGAGLLGLQPRLR